MCRSISFDLHQSLNDISSKFSHYYIFLLVELLERNSGYFSVNPPWKFVCIIFIFRMAAFLVVLKEVVKKIEKVEIIVNPDRDERVC